MKCELLLLLFYCLYAQTLPPLPTHSFDKRVLKKTTIVSDGERDEVLERKKRFFRREVEEEIKMEPTQPFPALYLRIGS